MSKRPWNKTLKQRFDEKWMPEPNSGCWLWMGAVSGGKWGGYGLMRIEGQNKQATRISWQLHRGDIAKGLLICHKCDTPACVNPDHLFLGTSTDNQIDCISKKRRLYPCGERAANAKLTSEQVELVRCSAKRQPELAAQLGVSRQTISAIRTGATWKRA